MGGSIKLFTVRGIPVRVHFSFLLVILWAGYIAASGSRAMGDNLGVRLAFTELFVLLLFACVVLHELAHALTAQLFDVTVQDVTLWPLGGVARMAAMPENPFQEFLITAAGPAMSIFLTLALGAALLLVAGPSLSLQMILPPWVLGTGSDGWSGRTLLALLVAQNALLAAFNLVPAFPLDGGRLLRALLAGFLPFATATRVASLTGQVLAGVLLVVAVLMPNFLLALVAVFVFFVAGQERQQVITSGNLHGLQVRQAMQPLGTRLHPLQTLGQVAGYLANSSQSFYLVVDTGRLVGILSRGDVLAGLRQHGPNTRVAQQMTRDVVRLAPDTPLAAARDRLMQQNVWLAVVVENGQVVGTLSQGDLNRLADLLKSYPGLLPRDG